MYIYFFKKKKKKENKIKRKKRERERKGKRKREYQLSQIWGGAIEINKVATYLKLHTTENRHPKSVV